MKQFLSLEYFYKFSTQIAKYLFLIGFVLFIYGIIMGLFIVPSDKVQSAAFRIMYVHVPCAILSLSIYTIVGILSFVYLIWHIKLCDVLAKVSAPFGAMVTFIALISGALWGKPMWGTWWVWDARLTSELILLFLYFGYIGLRNAVADRKVAATMCAIFAVIGLIDIPIIHFSVQWWNTLHQGATISKFARPSIDSTMLYPLLSMILAMFFLYAAVVCIRASTEILWRERKTKWIAQLLQE